MGHVRVPISLANPEHRERVEVIPDALIDTGATWTTLPRSIADRLELKSLGEITDRTASAVQTLEQSYAYIEIGEKRSVSPVLISETLEIVLVGVLTLEALAMAVDPGTGPLRESEVLLL